MKKKALTDLARTIRSKNAGSLFITVEIIFDDFDIYNKVKTSDCISQFSIAKLYGVSKDQILDFCFYDPGMGIKANIGRKSASRCPSFYRNNLYCVTTHSCWNRSAGYIYN